MRTLRSCSRHHAPPSEHFTPVTRPSQGGSLACRFIGATLLAAAVAATPVEAQNSGSTVDLARTLLHLGRRVEQWYARAQTVISKETVSIQPLRSDLSPAGFPRRLAFELRVAWDPERIGQRGVPEAIVLRDVQSINGRPTRDEDDPGCMDPKPVSPEPLAMLLPARLAETEFSLAGAARVDGRPAVMIDYRGAGAAPPDIDWTEECVTVSLPGRSRGRIWVDTRTHDVLRMDDRLVGQFEFDVPREYVRRGAAPSMVIERADSSIRYKPVEFQDPPEMLMLPASIETVTVIRGTGVQRVRISQRFSDHRRFLTAGRILY